MVKKVKSPLKDRPLRYVAQSADEAIDDLISDKLLMYYIAACFCLVGIAVEWISYFRPVQTPPVIISTMLGVGAIFCCYKIYVHFKKLKALKLGRDGERAVGQYLESLRESGCHIYHDILGDSFNVDHVVISDKGIFVIETKTYSKPATGRSAIHYDGEKVLVNGNETRRDIIVQVKAAASYIKKILKESTGKNFEPFPVVLFPGWFIEGNGNRKGKLWVLEPKAFRKFVEGQPAKLAPEDVALASYHLSRYIRTYKRDK